MSDAIEAFTDDYNQQMAKEAELDSEGRECLERALDHAREVFDKITKGKNEWADATTEVEFDEIDLGERAVYLASDEGEGVKRVGVMAIPYKAYTPEDYSFKQGSPAHNGGSDVLEIGFLVRVPKEEALLPSMALPVADLDYTKKSLDTTEQFIKFADEVAGLTLEQHRPFIHSNIGVGRE